MQIQKIDVETYRAFLERVPRYFHSQTCEQFLFQQAKGTKGELLALVDTGADGTPEILLATKILFFRRLKYFQQAVVSWGPLPGDASPALFGAFLNGLEAYLRAHHPQVVELRLTPFVVRRLHETGAAPDAGTDDPQALAYESLLLGQGYRKQAVDLYDDTSVQPRYISVKPIGGQTEAEVFASLDAKVRNHMRVCRRYGMEIRELGADELDVFLRFLYETAARTRTKEAILSIPTAQTVSCFGERMRILAVYLDFAAARKENEAQLEECAAIVAELEAKEQRNKNENAKLTQNRQMVQAARRRLDRLEALEAAERADRPDCTGAYLCAAQYYSTPGDLICAQTGTGDRYVDLSPAYLIHEEMLRSAVRDGQQYYNFFAVADPQGLREDKGVVRFKQQFGAHVEEYMGTFDKTIRKPLLYRVLRLVKGGR